MATIAAIRGARTYRLTRPHKRLLASLAAVAFTAGCAHVPPPASAPAAKAPQSSAAPASPLAAKTAAPAAAIAPASLKPAPPAPPLSENLEITARALPTLIDLTAPADDLWDRLRKGFSMPNLDSPLVQNREAWYAGQPEYLKRMAERSKRYLYYIVEEIERRGMPTELALLPMVESAFNPMAYSRAHASGLWQFIPSTGKNYNLQQNHWTDARRDIVASTNAALDYLQFLYDMHGDWHLALASYNWGENAVARAIEKNRAKGLPTDYASLAMPTETRWYVPKFQALKNIIATPEAFGVALAPIANAPYFITVPRTQDMDIRLAARLAEMPVDELIALNPGLNRPVFSGSQTQTLVLPADRVDAFQTNLDAWDKPLTSWQRYTMKSGDRLDRLAAAHGIALAKLKLANGINTRTKVGPGYPLLLPVKGSGAAAEPLPAVFHPPVLPAPRARKVIYVVKKGDTLQGIAQRFRVSTDNLRRWNHIGRLTTGEKLAVYVHAVTKTRKAVKKNTRATAASAAKPPLRLARP